MVSEEVSVPVSVSQEEGARQELVERIVGLQAHIAQLVETDRALAWLDVDLTIQQIKAVLVLVRAGSLTAGQIGRELRVGFSTVTGLVDRLAEQGLVSRGEDPQDRRATRVVPTEAAVALVERLYAYRREALRHLLEHVSSEALLKLAEGLAEVEQAATAATARATVAAVRR
jgi:DNA-binding MarR family transcriptional regulator